MGNIYFVKVPRSSGEETRKKLLENNYLEKSISIHNEQNFIFIPIKEESIKKLKELGHEIEERDDVNILKKTVEPKNLKEALLGILTQEQIDNLTKSFEIIGDLAIMEIPEDLEINEKKIGKALLKVHKNVNGVFKKESAMEGEFRVRKIKNIAGEMRTETVHKENGILMKLDIGKVYFSARLSNERKRISALVKNGEKIMVFFAGVGPYALLIGKEHKDTQIVAIELNPIGVKYLKENIDLNKLKNIVPIEGDVEKIIIENRTKYENFADRIIMPLPKTAHDFLDVAYEASKNKAIVHFYTIVNSKMPLENAKKYIDSKKFEILDWRVVKPYSPELVQIVVNLKTTKNLCRITNTTHTGYYSNTHKKETDA